MLEQMDKRPGQGKLRGLRLQADCYGDAKNPSGKIGQRGYADTVVNPVGPVVGSHTGPAGICYEKGDSV